jgi:hypothetical protein
VVDTGVLVLLEIWKFFLAHIDHDCGSRYEKKHSLRRMKAQLWSIVVEYCVIYCMVLSSVGDRFILAVATPPKFPALWWMLDATPSPQRHFLRAEQDLSRSMAGLSHNHKILTT